MSCISRRFLVSLISSFVYTAIGTFESDTRKESFSSLAIVGEIQCGLMCVQNGRCDAINYNRDNLICELVETSAAAAASETAGWKYTSDFDFVAAYSFASLCSVSSIPKASVCVDLHNQNIALVQSECTTPLSLPSNAIASIDQMDVGVSVTFTCDTGYVGSGVGSSTCLADGQWSSNNYQCSEEVWPEGTYTLLQPIDGCPTGFVTGQRVWCPERTGFSAFSSNSNLQGYANQTQIDWHFCSKTVDDSNDPWPAGDYCIMRQGGACPTGFGTGSITIDEEDSAPSGRSQGSGTLPDGEYTSNSIVHFCCRDDGSVAVTVTFPKTTPFILFPYTVGSCQLITGMTAVPGYTFFDTEPNGNIDTYTGLVPYKGGPPTWYIHHCYYH